MTEWQPIETAPKDGSAILAWWDASGSHGIIAWCACRAHWIETGDANLPRYEEVPLPIAEGASH